MLINHEEICNLAWLDSRHFDKEGFLLIKDNSINTDQINYVERFVRLRGNLLFILKIPNFSNNKLSSSDSDRRKLHSLGNQTTANDNKIDNDELLTNERIEFLNSFYKKKSTTSKSELDQTLLSVLVLNCDFGLRKFDDLRNCGFIIEFYNVPNSSGGVWSFACLTVEERDLWIDSVNKINHVFLKAAFNILLERKLKLIKKRNHHFLYSTSSDEVKEQLNNSSDSSSDNPQQLQLYQNQQPQSDNEDGISNDLVNKSNSTNNSSGVDSCKIDSTSIVSSLSIISNTSAESSTSKDRLSSFSKALTTTSLIAQNKLIKDGLKSVFLTDSYFKNRESFDKLAASYSFVLAIDLKNYRFNNFQASVFIKVYCSLTNGLDWSVLGRTEILEVIKETKFAKKFYLNLFEKIELQNNLQKIVQFDLEKKKVLLKFNIYNLVEPFTERYVLIGTAIDYFKSNSNIEIFSSVHYKPLQIGLLKMTTLDNNEFNVFNQHASNDAKTVDKKNNNEYSTQIDKKQTKSTPLLEFGFLVEPQLFVNTIHRSFQFELNTSDNNGKPSSLINITELMSEPVLIFTLVQDLMNVFMDDEKKLMNCITYSLGEVRQEYQRRQMQMLESHLRLVNLVTESINSLNQVQTGTKFYRKSVQKNEIFFQFVPLNLHLQRSIYNRQMNHHFQKRASTNMETFDILNIYTHGSFSAHRLGFDNGGQNKFINEIENSSKETGYFDLNKIWLAMRNYFKIINLQKQVSELNGKMVDLTLKLGKQTDLKLAKNSEFCDDFQKLKIDLIENQAAQQLLRDKVYCQQVILKLFSKMEECCFEMTKILDLKQVETTLGFLDVFRAQQSFSGVTDESENEEHNNEDDLREKESELKRNVELRKSKEISKDNTSNRKDQIKEQQAINPVAKMSMLSSMKSSLNSTMKFNIMNITKSTFNVGFKSKANQSKPSISKPIINSHVERTISKTISCPLDQVQSSNEMMKKTENQLRKLRRHNSENRIDDHLEFEPVELIHLNIKASLISMQSKLNQLINFSLESYKQEKFNYSSLYEKIVNEMKPSTKKLFNSIDSLVKTAQICYAIESLKLSKDQSEYFYLIRSRRNMVFSQVLTTFTLALLGELTCPKLNRNEYLDDLNNLNSFNNNFSGLHDLGDLSDLSNFNDNSKYLNKLFEQGQIVCFFESLLSCYAEEIGMLQDMHYAIRELNSIRVLFVNLYYDAGQFKKKYKITDDNLLNNGIYNTPKFEGNGYNIQITIPFYDENLPEEFKCDVVALLFNIGINESATLAETIGLVKHQDEINKESFLNLETFISSHADIKNTKLINNLTALKSELYSNRAKNVRILQLTEQIAYDLNAIRFTNCKSGKDRTSMACTLEQVRKSGQLFNFNEINQGKLFQQILDTLRSERVRRSNTTKNIGVPKYAFNSLRVMTLPKLYQPPSSTFGNVQT